MPKKSDKNVVMTRKQRIAASKRVEAADSISTSCVNGIQYLETPVKSRTDPSEYRALKLANGLTVLLISQQDNSVVVDNKQESIASCTLCIDAGDFNDPPKISGIARLLTSVILRGSKKNPTYKLYENLIRCNGSGIELFGSTDTEKTTFWLQTIERNFADVLKIFASCFVEISLVPQMVEDARNIGPSVHPMALWDGSVTFGGAFTDREILLQILGSGNDKHPGKYIKPGFKSNLYCYSKKKIFDETEKFMKLHYSAHRMKVFIKASMPLDKLEYYANKYFSEISNNGLPPPDLTCFRFDECFDTADFHMIYQIPASLDSDNHKIELNWPFPPIKTLYKSKPYRYISVWMLYDGPGSLMWYYKRKNWCTKIACGIGENDYEDNLIYSIFNVTLTLTDEGYKNRKKVIGTVYSYINFLRCDGPKKKLFERLQKSAENTFRNDYETCRKACYASIPKTMQFCSSAEYITGMMIYFEYDPDLIKRCLNLLSPEKANVIVHNKYFDAKNSNTDRRNKFVHIVDKFKYRKAAIPKDWIEYWKTVDPVLAFDLLRWQSSLL